MGEITMQIEITEINKKIADAQFIADCENSYQQTVLDTAKKIIAEKDNCPIILISGPSGSGKTTTAMMLEKALDEMGHETHVLSMDNYFYPMTKEQQQLALV